MPKYEIHNEDFSELLTYMRETGPYKALKKYLHGIGYMSAVAQPVDNRVRVDTIDDRAKGTYHVLRDENDATDEPGEHKKVKVEVVDIHSFTN